MVLIFGGDGTLHHLINSFYDLENEKDHKQMNIPLILFPVGSGNSLCGAIASQGNEETTIQNSLYFIFHGVDIKVALSEINAKIYLENGREMNKKLLSFSLLSWGLVASIDVESNNYKWLRGLRYTVTGIKNLITSSDKSAIVKIKPIDYSYIDNSEIDEEGWIYITKKEGDVLKTILLTTIRNLTKTLIISNDIDLGFQGFILMIANSNINFMDILKLLREKNYQNFMMKQNLTERTNRPPCIQQYKIKEFYFETNEGYMVVDGELIHEGKFEINSKISTLYFNVLGNEPNN